MTLEAALIAVERLHVLFLMFGLILFASNAASTRQAEDIRATKRKKKTIGRGKGKQRTAKNLKVKGKIDTPTAKGKEPRPLSESKQRMHDAYIIGRDYPNFKTTSSVPL